MPKALSLRIERDGSCLCRSRAVVMAASSAFLMVCLGLRFYFYVCGGIVFGVYYGCTECGVAFDS